MQSVAPSSLAQDSLHPLSEAFWVALSFFRGRWKVQIFLVVAFFTRVLGCAFSGKSNISHELSSSPSLQRMMVWLCSFELTQARWLITNKALKGREHEVKHFLHIDRHVYHLSQKAKQNINQPTISGLPCNISTTFCFLSIQSSNGGCHNLSSGRSSVSKSSTTSRTLGLTNRNFRLYDRITTARHRSRSLEYTKWSYAL